MPITSEPPANPLPDGGGFVRYEGHWESQPWALIHGLRFTGTPAGTDLNDLANDFYTAWEDNLLDWTSDDNFLTKATVVGTFSGDVLEGVHVGSEHGSSSDDNLPLATCALISWTISSHYRGGKPRSYVAGATAGALDDARSFRDDFVTTLTALAQAYLAAANILAEGGITAVECGVWALYRGGVALDPPVFHPYTDAHVQKRICTQRRRLGAEF